MAILDTGFMIDYLWNIQTAIDLFENFKKDGETLRTTSINVYELIKGAEMSKNRERDLSKVTALLEITEVVNFNDKMAKLAVRIFAELSKQGKMNDDFDVMIAAVCLYTRDKIVTKNIKHFERVNGLKIETY